MYLCSEQKQIVFSLVVVLYNEKCKILKMRFFIKMKFLIFGIIFYLLNLTYLASDILVNYRYILTVMRLK